MRILVVDDDPALRDALDRALRLEGHQVEFAHDGVQALQMVAQPRHDAVVLDIGLPRVDGLEVCRRIRAGGDRTPILMLTARDAVEDRVAGLDVGADDYLVKPFALAELLARVRALVRRAAPPTDPDEVLRFEDLVLEPATMAVHRGERRIDLTLTEFRILELLVRNARRIVPRALIFEKVWGYDFGASSNALEVFVSYLRRKLEAAGEARLIHTVRGVGYALRDR
ncbi:MAG: response regulator transcription factor [Chloroflexi bacterium]|nr:MAG: response regulator transcription factor [Chloroflexota bacterium]TME16350.1 MAG: response regulator transcription factor [Chloroflexota bacterium]TME19155.1 MAG: response regulator transcription factor [Chloroflexota bacterium]